MTNNIIKTLQDETVTREKGESKSQCSNVALGRTRSSKSKLTRYIQRPYLVTCLRSPFNTTNKHAEAEDIQLHGLLNRIPSDFNIDLRMYRFEKRPRVR